MKTRLGLLLFACATVLSGCADWSPGYSDKYIVFFDAQSATISPTGKAILDRAAAAIKAERPPRVAIAGEPADAPPHQGFNPKLSEPRFAAVENALVLRGVNAQLMSRAAMTETEAKLNPSGKRRVEIRLLKS